MNCDCARRVTAARFAERYHLSAPSITIFSSLKKGGLLVFFTEISTKIKETICVSYHHFDHRTSNSRIIFRKKNGAEQQAHIFFFRFDEDYYYHAADVYFLGGYG